MSLSFYLSEKGIPEFQEWYSRIDIFKTIKKYLDELTVLLSNAYKLFNHTVITTLKNSIKCILSLQFQISFSKQPLEIFTNWLNYISPYCFQGGFGHSIKYMGSPHHWCIKPENYKDIENIPNEVKIAGVILSMHLEISPIAELEKWST